jgi:heterodisulfide reductase subunit A-like polyferredoxin/coenzyme F420-reducing hydrogenase delta subunit
MKRGLFFSRCQGALGDSLDLGALSAGYAHLEAVRVFDDFYDLAAFDELLKEVETKGLEAVVLAGDSPLSWRSVRNGEQLLWSLEERGVDRNRIDFVNLKNMVVRPHRASPRVLQEKARVLVDVALAKAERSGILENVEVAPRQAVAIIGAGAGSLSAAQQMLDQGYRVHLVDEASDSEMMRAESPHVRATLAYISHHRRFTWHASSSITDFSGFTGDYHIAVANGKGGQSLDVGAVILSATSGPRPKDLQRVFHVDVDEAGKLVSRDDTSAPSQTTDRGVFVINPAEKSGGGLDAELLAADSAAAMVINLLNRREILNRVTVSQVRTELCGGCAACVKTCMFNAVSLVGRPAVSVIDPRRCRGCGNCVTACPAGARDLAVCPTSYLFAAVDILSRFQPGGLEPRILALACDGCGYRALDQAAELGETWPVGILPLWVVCGGQIDTQLIMHGLVRGFDGVLLLICGEGCCHNLVGNVDLERRVNLFREILLSRGFDPARVQTISTCTRRKPDCMDRIRAFHAQTQIGTETTQAVTIR